MEITWDSKGAFSCGGIMHLSVAQSVAAVQGLGSVLMEGLNSWARMGLG